MRSRDEDRECPGVCFLALGGLGLMVVPADVTDTKGDASLSGGDWLPPCGPSSSGASTGCSAPPGKTSLDDALRKGSSSEVPRDLVLNRSAFPVELGVRSLCEEEGVGDVEPFSCWEREGQGGEVSRE